MFKVTNSFKKSQTIIPVVAALLLSASPAFAAAPDGMGPAADTVVSSSQGLMKNGLAVSLVRSDPTSALGVPENNTIDGNFFALGFGGNIVLGLDNGISDGVIVIESTELFYPGETASIEMSDDGVTWVMAGNVTQDGTVNKPDGLVCARYVRITDTSTPANFPDVTADGYDVDGITATGDACTVTPTPTVAPTTAPSNPGGGGGGGGNGGGDGLSDGRSDGMSDGRSSSSQTTTTTTTTLVRSTVPGFPNTGAPCVRVNPLIPCLPNTGIDPEGKKTPWLIAAGLVISLITFSLFRRGHKFSAKR